MSRDNIENHFNLVEYFLFDGKVPFQLSYVYLFSDFDLLNVFPFEPQKAQDMASQFKRRANERVHLE